MVNKRAVGVVAEKHSVDFLISKNYKIRDVNFRCKLGEIDIIAEFNNYLIFIEVKYRATNKFGYPMEAVTKTKQNKIIKTAKFYLMLNNINHMDCRFDVIEVYGDLEKFTINHVENAFWT